MYTILCIDDRLDGLEVRQAFLEAAGYHALIATSGPAGLQLAEAEAIDLVLLDYKMEPMDGREVAGRLRRSQPRLPIILLTGYVLELPPELVQMVDRVIAKGSPARELIQTIEQLVGAISPRAPVDRHMADELIEMSVRQAGRTRESIVQSQNQAEKVRARLHQASSRKRARKQESK